MLYPTFARVKFYDDFEGKEMSEDIWFFATSYVNAVKEIEEYYGGETIIGFSIYMFEENNFFHRERMAEMEVEAKTALGIS